MFSGLILAILLTTLLLFSYFYDFLFRKSDEIFDFKFINSTNDAKIILFYTQLFGDSYFKDLKNQNFQLCPKNCRLTNNLAAFEKSSAVIFHARDTKFLPSKFSREQKFVFHTAESPEMSYVRLKNLPPKIFDFTMTYRSDSDIFCPYGGFKMTENFYSGDSPKNKGLLVWLVSNCFTTSRREFYVEKLSQFIKIDIFGRCGHRDRKFDDAEISNYKFYLSLENAQCTDYVTEKFFRRLQLPVVPIVLQRKVYQRLLPSNLKDKFVFIALDDFESPQFLAEYLRKLDKNDYLYNRYFEWRRKFTVEAATNVLPASCLCDLCQKLYSRPKIESKIDIDAWWYNKSDCQSDYAMKLM
uniref:Fucosyltransferase n=1 Tax=Romanomermis culicivorax TaxID=13658 RepID=A0A915JPT4_ROMCU